MAEAAQSGKFLFLRTGILSVVLFASAGVATGAQPSQRHRNAPPSGQTGRSADGDLAGQILEATELKGGLIVHLGCGDGKLTAALHAGGSYVVHGLDTDADDVRKARESIQGLGIYGPVSVECFDGKNLPHAENLVNLLVAEDLGSVAIEEAMRVLAPGGSLYLKQDGRWKRIVKPRPKDVDQWTHFLHDASGNAVAHDQVVGPPGRLQWTAGPRYTRSHEHIPGIYALVSAGGRIFYIVDQAPIASIRQPPQWHLVARDAFNGTQLWKRPITEWFPHIVNWGRTPRQLQRRLVAAQDRVYVTLGLHSPLSAVDAATGDILRVYENTEGTEEILCHKGTLLLAVRGVTDQRVAELARWAKLVVMDDSPLYARESAEPLVRRLRATEAKGEKAVLALDANTGRSLWKKAGADASGLRTYSLCAGGDRVFYQNGRDVVCLDLRTGRERWRTPSAPLRLVWGRTLFCADGRTVTALSAETGKTRWTQAPAVTQVRDVFVANGSLWVGGFKPYKGKRGPAWGPYFATQRDLDTGKMLMHVEPENPGHHHRCYQNKATDRYILAGRRGTEFIDLSSGDVRWHSWARGVCKYGVMPCNGLLYTPPHACACYVAAKLTGFNALAPMRKRKQPAHREAPTPQRGPAFRRSSNGQSSQSSIAHRSDWPTYRHDAQRSGCTRSPVPAVLRRRWKAEIGGELTSPTVAEGKVLVASVDEHRVCAIDAGSGRSVWCFTAGARVDSPPTWYQGRAIFGCRDGYVYSVRASDGVLAWRLRAARHRRRIAADGQLESASPVLGSVLVQDGVAYGTAGRSSYLDGGVDLCRIEPETGEMLSRTPIYSPDPQTGKQPKQFAPSAMPGARADILAADGNHVYLRDAVFDQNGARQPERSPHLFTLTDFLDDAWAHRSYWIFGTRCSISTGCSGRDRDLIYGRLLVFDGSTIYGYGRANVHWSNQLQDGAYRLFALKRGTRTRRWEKRVPVRVRAMVLADKVLLVAGPRMETGDAPWRRDEDRPALLVAVSASDGTELARHRLDGSPVFDGMAAADGRLYISLENGQLVCMGDTATRDR